jgi:hypothetical protein
MVTPTSREDFSIRRFAPGNYYILGGTQGRFIIKGRKVYSVGEIYPIAEVHTSHLKTNGMSIDEFIKSIEKIL